MKWLGRPSPFHLFTNPCVINRFIFCQGVVIYYIHTTKTRFRKNAIHSSLLLAAACNGLQSIFIVPSRRLKHEYTSPRCESAHCPFVSGFAIETLTPGNS